MLKLKIFQNGGFPVQNLSVTSEPKDTLNFVVVATVCDVPVFRRVQL